MIRISLRRQRPAVDLAMPDPVELLTHLRTQVDAAFDPRDFPPVVAPVTAPEAQIIVRQALEQTLTTARTIAALHDRLRTSATPDRMMHAIYEVSSALQDVIPALVTAATSTCPRPDDQ